MNNILGFVMLGLTFVLSLGAVSAPLISGFGIIVGGLTILSAIGIFFLVRRK